MFLVYPEDKVTHNEFTILIASQNLNLHSFWGGEWRSNWLAIRYNEENTFQVEVNRSKFLF